MSPLPRGEISQQLQELSEGVQALQKAMEPVVDIMPQLGEIVEAYDSVLFGKKFLIGLASVVSSIAAIGGSVLLLLNYIRGHEG